MEISIIKLLMIKSKIKKANLFKLNLIIKTIIDYNNKINKAKNNRTNKIIKNKRLEKSEQKVIIKDKKK